MVLKIKYSFQNVNVLLTYVKAHRMTKYTSYFLTPKIFLAASTTSLADGSIASSKVQAYGIGPSTPVTLTMGASRWKKYSLSMSLAQMSAPTPHDGQPSSTVIR
uniref:Uncharacterized protein n=1 Tax=Homalodisca liturata TaxID=320908 RepID=A0A1B6J166_9HEMI